MFRFIQITYEELQNIYQSQHWVLDWSIIDKNYMDGCEKILTKENELIGLIYYSLDNPPQIAKFEIKDNKKRLGFGKAVIKEFLLKYSLPFQIFPFSEEAVVFWEKCGFEGDYLGMTYLP